MKGTHTDPQWRTTSSMIYGQTMMLLNGIEDQRRELDADADGKRTTNFSKGWEYGCFTMQ